MRDEGTERYFNKLTPHFDPKRFEFALDFIRNHANSDTKLIDVGCGNGATLALIRHNTDVKYLAGMDISENYLKQAKETVGCETIHGSILDPDCVARLTGRFDFCVLGAVLHHLIGCNRRESYSNVQVALANSLKLLKPEGFLIIFEPTHSPAFLMSAVFYLKKFFSTFTEGRFEIFQRWVNLGQPIVSYYTLEQLESMTHQLRDAEVVERKVVDARRMGLVIRRTGLGLILKKRPILSG